MSLCRCKTFTRPAKPGSIRFTLALAKETSGSGVGVFLLAPGMLVTDLLTDVEVIQGYGDWLKVMGTIVRMWARPPEEAAEKAVWIASPATDGKTGRVVKMVSFGSLLGGALREGLRRVAGQPAPPPVNLRVVPAVKLSPDHILSPIRDGEKTNPEF